MDLWQKLDIFLAISTVYPILFSSLTDNGLFKAGIHWQDVLLHQLHGARPLGDLLI